MKTKNQRLIFSGMLLTLAVLFLLTGVFDQAEPFSGYIPAGEMPKVAPIQRSSPFFEPKTTIHVVVDKKDTILVYLNNKYFLGSNFVFHNENYILTGGRVFIKGYKAHNKNYGNEAFLQF